MATKPIRATAEGTTTLPLVILRKIPTIQGMITLEMTTASLRMAIQDLEMTIQDLGTTIQDQRMVTPQNRSILIKTIICTDLTAILPPATKRQSSFGKCSCHWMYIINV